jgi:hypothetical protein
MQVLAAGLTLACAPAAADASTSRMFVVTQADSGKTFRLVAGAHAELHLSGKWVWSTPAVRGAAVELTPIRYFRDPGFSGWSLDAAVPGKARIRATGSPACRTCARPPRRFVVTIVVRPRKAASSVGVAVGLGDRGLSSR